MNYTRLKSSTQKDGSPWRAIPALGLASCFSALALVIVMFATLNNAARADGVSARDEKKQQVEKIPAAKDCCAGLKLTDAGQPSGQSKTEENQAAPTRQQVLEPSQFFGLATFGYASAKANPEIMEKLFCYCGCDLTDKHSTLLDCFTSQHGVDCHICQEEAILAVKLHKDGMSMADIQKTIDEKYSHEYPFEEDTPNYRQYKRSRLYIKNAESSAGKPGLQVAGPDAPDDKPVNAHPKLKPGKTAGNCCAGDEHKPGEENNAKRRS